MAEKIKITAEGSFVLVVVRNPKISEPSFAWKPWQIIFTKVPDQKL